MLLMRRPVPPPPNPHTETQTLRPADTQTHRDTHRHRDKHTHRHTDTDRQTDRHTHTHRQTHTHTQTHTLTLCVKDEAVIPVWDPEPVYQKNIRFVPVTHCRRFTSWALTSLPRRRTSNLVRGGGAPGETVELGSNTGKDCRLHPPDWTDDLTVAWERGRKKKNKGI